MSLPIGAEEIARARDDGKRPEDHVVVSLCGRQPCLENPQVIVTRSDHNWDFMAGLEAVIYVRHGAEHIQATLRGLCRPCERIAMWDVVRETGMDVWPVWQGRGEEFHYLALHFRKHARFKRWQVFHWPQVLNTEYKRGIA